MPKKNKTCTMLRFTSKQEKKRKKNLFTAENGGKYIGKNGISRAEGKNKSTISIISSWLDDKYIT